MRVDHMAAIVTERSVSGSGRARRDASASGADQSGAEDPGGSGCLEGAVGAERIRSRAHQDSARARTWPDFRRKGPRHGGSLAGRSLAPAGPAPRRRRIDRLEYIQGIGSREGAPRKNIIGHAATISDIRKPLEGRPRSPGLIGRERGQTTTRTGPNAGHDGGRALEVGAHRLQRTSLGWSWK